MATLTPAMTLMALALNYSSCTMGERSDADAA